jgi:hypothetical protein
VREIIRTLEPGQFNPRRHFYTGALAALPDAGLEALLATPPAELAQLYCDAFPEADRALLSQILEYRPRFLQWAGSDLFLVRNPDGRRDVALLEMNSCPSGQKYMPGAALQPGGSGYDILIDEVLAPAIPTALDGVLAVLYDKNGIEASGYAAALADRMCEPVHLVPLHHAEADRFFRAGEGGIDIRTASGWRPVRGAWRYLTDRPWRRLPLRNRGAMVNQIVACIAGGRNKAAAAFAYDEFNRQFGRQGITIRVPRSVIDVAREDLPRQIASFGGRAIVKVPYSNAGQGVFPVISNNDLSALMARHLPYERLIVQELIGAERWSGEGMAQIGTIPDRQGNAYAADLRLMVGATARGFRPVAAYGRRARAPLPQKLGGNGPPADFLLTNLSYRENDRWKSDKARVLVLDRRNMDHLGWQALDLVNGYVQTCFAMIAIDRLACQLMHLPDRAFLEMLRSISDDPSLRGEIAHLNLMYADSAAA